MRPTDSNFGANLFDDEDQATPPPRKTKAGGPSHSEGRQVKRRPAASDVPDLGFDAPAAPEPPLEIPDEPDEPTPSPPTETVLAQEDLAESELAVETEPATDRPRRGRRDRKRDRHRQDRGRDRHEHPRPERESQASPRPEREQRADRPRPAHVTSRSTTVAILVDAAALSAQAREQGAEISFSRLLRHLLGDGQPTSRMVYVPEGADELGKTLQAHGLNVTTCSAAELPVAFAVDAALAARDASRVVLATTSSALGPLVSALRARDVRVETAHFGPEGPVASDRHHQLGRSCLFVP